MFRKLFHILFPARTTREVVVYREMDPMSIRPFRTTRSRILIRQLGGSADCVSPFRFSDEEIESLTLEDYRLLSQYRFVINEEHLERAVERMLLALGLLFVKSRFSRILTLFKKQLGVNGTVKIIFAPLKINLNSLHPIQATA